MVGNSRAFAHCVCMCARVASRNPFRSASAKFLKVRAHSASATFLKVRAHNASAKFRKMRAHGLHSILLYFLAFQMLNNYNNMLFN